MTCKRREQCDHADLCRFAQSDDYNLSGGSCFTLKDPQTNEEWLKHCNTEQLAEWLQKHMDCAICGCNKDLCYKGYDCCRLAFVEWLKQPHHNEVGK